MLVLPISILLAASSLLGLSLAHNIQLAAHSHECFHEQLKRDDRISITFQVGDREFGSAGNLDVDFWVRRFMSLEAQANEDCGIDRESTRYQGNSRTGSVKW